MEGLKKFQGSTFNTIVRRRLIKDQDTIFEFIRNMQELQNEINCMSDSRSFKILNQSAVEIPTLPLNQRLSYIQFLLEC